MPEPGTPASWSREVLAILSRIDPSYRKNPKAKGRFIEFVREDEAGLLLSHNFIRVRDSYYLNFALLFSDRPTLFLFHPLVAGRRFHNQGIWRQIHDDFGLHPRDHEYPRGTWDGGPWRKNTLENLERGLRISEEWLHPRYLATLEAGAPHLVALFERASILVPALRERGCVVPSHLDERAAFMAEDNLIRWAPALGLDPNVAAGLLPLARGLDALAIARDGTRPIGQGSVNELPLEIVVLRHIDVFMDNEEALPRILSIARVLASRASGT